MGAGGWGGERGKEWGVEHTWEAPRQNTQKALDGLQPLASLTNVPCTPAPSPTVVALISQAAASTPQFPVCLPVSPAPPPTSASPNCHKCIVPGYQPPSLCLAWSPDSLRRTDFTSPHPACLAPPPPFSPSGWSPVPLPQASPPTSASPSCPRLPATFLLSPGPHDPMIAKCDSHQGAAPFPTASAPFPTASAPQAVHQPPPFPTPSPPTSASPSCHQAPLP